MAIFRKKTTSTNIPELQEYYANQRRESTGLAWLLAIGSLLITAAVIIGLFIGGRWAYRKISNRNKDDNATTQVVNQPSTSTTSTSTSTTPSSTSTTTTPSSTSTTTTTPSSAATSTTTPTTSTSTTTSTTPAQGVSTTQSTTTNSSAVAATTTVKTVPDTGAGNTIAVFMAIAIVAFMVSRSYQIRRASK